MRLRSNQFILLIGALAFFVLTGCWIVLEVAVSGELARGTGLRVAVLGTLFDIPVLLCLGAGVFCTLASGALFLHHRLTSQKSA